MADAGHGAEAAPTLCGMNMGCACCKGGCALHPPHSLLQNVYVPKYKGYFHGQTSNLDAEPFLQYLEAGIKQELVYLKGKYNTGAGVFKGQV